MNQNLFKFGTFSPKAEAYTDEKIQELFERLWRAVQEEQQIKTVQEEQQTKTAQEKPQPQTQAKEESRHGSQDAHPISSP